MKALWARPYLRRWGFLGISIFFLGLTACATHQTKLAGPRQQMRVGQFDEALTELQKLSEEDSGDKLLYLMEYGAALHSAGRFKESNQVFLKAARLAEELDYHSVSRVAVAALGSEEMLQYKGESYEKLLIHAYLAMNFLMLGEKDSALVEVRRINEKVNKIRSEGRENYEYNPFAIYLSALIYESERQYDDAYIAFEKAYALDPAIPSLPEDLLRSSRLARRPDALRKWKNQFPGVVDTQENLDRNWGEIILLFEQGWGPRKDFSRIDHRFPTLVPERSETQSLLVNIQGNGKKFEGRSVVVYDVEKASMETLEADYKWMVARKIGAFVAKEVVAEQIRKKNEALGALAGLAMHLSDRADLRNWATLPQTIQVVRIPLPAGQYTMDLQGLGWGKFPTGDRMEKIEVKVKAGQKSFYAWRSLR